MELDFVPGGPQARGDDAGPEGRQVHLGEHRLVTGDDEEKHADRAVGHGWHLFEADRDVIIELAVASGSASRNSAASSAAALR